MSLDRFTLKLALDMPDYVSLKGLRCKPFSLDAKKRASSLFHNRECEIVFQDEAGMLCRAMGCLFAINAIGHAATPPHAHVSDDKWDIYVDPNEIGFVLLEDYSAKWNKSPFFASGMKDYVGKTLRPRPGYVAEEIGCGSLCYQLMDHDSLRHWLCVSKFLKPVIIPTGSGRPQDTAPVTCSCTMMALMRDGCRCGAMARERTRV